MNFKIPKALRQKIKPRCLPALISLLLGAGLAEAHHSYSMFSRDVEKVISGTVDRWAFNNPHSWLYVKVPNAMGGDTLWSFEAAAPPQLIGRGVTGYTFKPGDKVTLMYCPLVDGRPGGAIGWVQLQDGRYIDPSDGGCDGGAENTETWKVWLKRGIMSNQDVQ